MPTAAKTFFALCAWVCAMVAGVLSLPMLVGWTDATGTILSLVDNECRGDPYAPVVTFSDSTGVARTFTSESCSQGWVVGEDVALVYDPADPSSAALVESLYVVLGASILCLLAALGLTVFVVRDLRRKRSSPAS